MAEVPTFFFSHARQDREMPGNYLLIFFRDLEKKLGQWLGVNVQEKRLGTIDTRVPHGENWDADLSRGLSNDRVFVAILTPLYFKRPNCGKELAVFLLRHRDLGIDSNGALTGVRNVLPIRWLPENAYTINARKDSLIPPILRLIEDMPADDGNNPQRTQAIERYRKKGMEKCVRGGKYYDELIDLLVETIRDIPDLPPTSNVSFATANDAFNYNWRFHLTSTGAPVEPPSAPPLPGPGVRVSPRALASIVVFYVTRRQFTLDSTPVDFADSLIAEAPQDMTAPRDAVFDALLADIHTAGVTEGFTVFHAVAKPAVPTSPEPLLGRLASLSESRVLTALVVEPTVWPGTTTDAAAAVERIIGSRDWTGPVLLPSLDTGPVNVDDLVAARGLPARRVALAQASEARVTALRRAFVDARGRVLRTSTDQTPDAERVPVLKGAGAEGA